MHIYAKEFNFLARIACCTICYTAACGLISFLLVFNLFSWYLDYCCFVLVQLILVSLLGLMCVIFIFSSGVFSFYSSFLLHQKSTV